MPEAHELEGVTAVQGAKPVADHVAPLTQDGTVVHVRVVCYGGDAAYQFRNILVLDNVVGKLRLAKARCPQNTLIGIRCEMLLV